MSRLSADFLFLILSLRFGTGLSGGVPRFPQRLITWRDRAAFDLGGFGGAVVKVTRDTQDLSLPELRRELKVPRRALTLVPLAYSVPLFLGV